MNDNKWELFCDCCNHVRSKNPCEACGCETKIICVGCGHRTREAHQCRTLSIPPTRNSGKSSLRMLDN